MVVRRKYRSGGRVLADTPIPDAPAVTADAPAPPEPAPSPIGFEPSDAVARAVQAQRRAEELQRQRQEAQATPRPPEPSERRKAFLHQHRREIEGNEEAAFDYWKQARRMGIEDDTDEIDRYVLNGLRFEQQARAERLAPQQAGEPEASVRPPVARPEAPMPAPRKSMPMAAPVSREAPNVSSGQRRSNDMTLSAEEREIARNSIMDRPDMPRLTDAQKEYIYQQNRERMRQLKRDGIITDQGGR
jgi:hypothetical protein